MVEDALVTADIQAGRELLDQLERERFPLRAAAWVHESESGEWRLYLVTPIRNRDLLDAYLRVSEAMLADPSLKDELKRVSFKIVDAREALGKTLIEWAENTSREYRRVSGPLPRGSFVDAVVYGKAA